MPMTPAYVPPQNATVVVAFFIAVAAFARWIVTGGPPRPRRRASSREPVPDAPVLKPKPVVVPKLAVRQGWEDRGPRYRPFETPKAEPIPEEVLDIHSLFVLGRKATERRIRWTVRIRR